MKVSKIIVGLFIGLIGMSFWGVAQEGEYYVVSDFETWTSAELKLKPNKQWDFGFQGQVRLDHNSSEFKGYFLEASMGRRIFKGFDLGLGLRYTAKNDNEGKIQGIEHYFRYQLDATYKHKVDRFSLKYRFRYQNRNEIGVSKAEGDQNLQYFRLKAIVEYNIKNWKFDPVLSSEIFNRYVKDSYSNGFSDYRITIGTNYKTKKYGEIGLFYRYQKEISDFYPKATNIIRGKYTYTIKK